MKPKRAFVSYHSACVFSIHLLADPGRTGWDLPFLGTTPEKCVSAVCPSPAQPLVWPAAPSLDLSKKFPAVTLFVSQVLQPLQFGACCTGLWSWPGQMGCSDIRFYSAQLLLSKLVSCPNKEDD